MKVISYFFILSVLFVTRSAARFAGNRLLSGRNHGIESRISRCVGKSAKALFKPFNDISIITSDEDHHPALLQEMLKETFANRTVRLFTKFRTSSIDHSAFSVRDSSYVLIDDKYNCRRFMKHSSVERWSEYIIVIESTDQWLSKFAGELWKLGFIKVAFVGVSPDGSIGLFRPIQNPLARGSTPSLKAFDLCNENPKFRMTIHPFTSMLQTPTNGTLKFIEVTESAVVPAIGVKRDPTERGLGRNISKMFAAKYNIEFVECEKIAPWIDIMRGCVAGDYDVFYGNQLPDADSCCKEIEPVASFAFQTLIFVDSAKSSLHPLSGLVQPYSVTGWFVTLIIFSVFALFAYAIDALWSQRLVRERITVLEIWSVFMGHSLPHLPVKFSLRFVIGMWILYNFNSNLYYTSTFSSGLTVPDTTNGLTTYQDIADSGRRICGSSKTKQLFSKADDPTIASIGNRMEPIASRLAFGKILDENYIGTLLMSYVWMHNWINRGNATLQLYLISEAFVFHYPSVFFTKKGHPYTSDFDRLVSYARDAGVIDYLLERYADPLEKPKHQASLAIMDGPFLKLRHLQGAFYVLLIGHFISGIVFLIELWKGNKFGYRFRARN